MPEVFTFTRPSSAAPSLWEFTDAAAEVLAGTRPPTFTLLTADLGPSVFVPELVRLRVRADAAQREMRSRFATEVLSDLASTLHALRRVSSTGVSQSVMTARDVWETHLVTGDESARAEMPTDPDPNVVDHVNLLEEARTSARASSQRPPVLVTHRGDFFGTSADGPYTPSVVDLARLAVDTSDTSWPTNLLLVPPLLLEVLPKLNREVSDLASAPTDPRVMETVLRLWGEESLASFGSLAALVTAAESLV